MGDDRVAPDFPVDERTDKGFSNWFRSLEQDPSIIRFFDRKEFYTCHGSDALFIAKAFYKTTAVVKYMGGQEKGLAGVTLSRNLFEGVLRELLVERAEHTVQLFEGSGTQWRKAREASPGKLGAFEDELFRNADMADVPAVAAVALAYVEGARTVGVAFLDAAARRLGACEFADDEHFCSLEAVLLQLGAKEVVLPKDAEGAAQSADGARLRDVVARCAALGSERPRVAYATRNLEQDLARLLRSGNVEQHRDVLERPQAAVALAAVLAFGEALADGASHGKWALALYDTGRYMRLDAAAQRALNVLRQRTDANDSFSLYGLLNRGRTAMAKRLLKVWLKQPLVSLVDITTRHDVVDALASDPELRERLRDLHLRGLPDVERLTRKLERRRASLADLCQLYRASSRLPLIEAALRDHAGPHAPLLVKRYADRLADAHDAEHLGKFEELLEAAIDLDRIPDEYLIAASYDPQLEELRGTKDEVEERIDTIAKQIAGDLGLQLDKQVKLEWHRAANTRTRCMRITTTEEKKVRKQLAARYQTVETRKDGVKFTSKALSQAAERLQAVSREYDRCQHALVEQVVGVAATFAEVWETVGALLAELDLLAAFADLAANAPLPFVRPTMLPPDAGEIVLLGSRHPCVEAQEGVEFIKNDCRLKRGESWFQIITGPNMGGKSTYIRQVGVIVLLAQVGCFVPCDEARIAVRDCVFARVGAGDNQLRGVSTFMAEMLETAAILKGASARSLVIIDELGRGTSTYDGFGLAWAISEHLMREIGCPTLFATHFHELTALQGPGGVANLHVQTAIDEASGKLTMLYQVAEGACDQSFGIHVAEFARFPPEVVELARQKAAELEDFSAPLAAAADVEGAQRGSDGEPAAKRARTDGASDAEAAAAARARTFLQEFAALPLDALEEAAAVAQAGALYAELAADAEVMPALRAMLHA
ncbi:hypothetical protein WJX81_006373 [Elliptochloris bilobata]|uniref:DNA mismatch repair protein MSH2 n=1 Tax=Elliptochloris bilobata TaxID=381761 RepID=A0AAW1S8P3_9CHLO